MPAPSESQGDVAIYERPSRFARRMRFVRCCTLASALILFGAALFFRPGLVVAIPLLAASWTLYGGTVWKFRAQGKPAILLTPEGVRIRSVVDKVLPWQTIKGATLYRPYGSASPRLALSFDHDRIRAALPRGNNADVPKTLLEVVLDTADYEIEPDELERAFRDRIAATSLQPWNRAIEVVDTNTPKERAAIIFMMCFGFLTFLAIGLRSLHTETFRSAIAAPDYPRDRAVRLASASRDILRYPRDTRVRIAYATVLYQHGRLAAAEDELLKALADEDALAAMDRLETSRYKGVGMDLEEKVKLDLALVLAREGKTLRAKQTMAGVCPDVPNADMPILTALDLCHYSGR